MALFDLLEAHQFDRVLVECEKRLRRDPDDMAAIGTAAAALKALGRYEEALPYYEKVGDYEKRDNVAVGRPGRQKDIACIHWMLGDKTLATQSMTALVDGILDGSINYGDIAGGVSQGLLLYYMGLTAGDERAKTKALAYMRDRAKRSAIRMFPGPVARYYLDLIDFGDVLAAVTEKYGSVRDEAMALQLASTDLLRRRYLCVALFHDGIKARARGDERYCMKRMRECFALENPLIEQEWYLARYEVELVS